MIPNSAQKECSASFVELDVVRREGLIVSPQFSGKYLFRERTTLPGKRLEHASATEAATVLQGSDHEPALRDALHERLMHHLKLGGRILVDWPTDLGSADIKTPPRSLKVLRTVTPPGQETYIEQSFEKTGFGRLKLLVVGGDSPIRGVMQLRTP